MPKKVRNTGRTNKRPGSRPMTARTNAPRLRPTDAPVSELETAEIVADDVEAGLPATAAAVLESNARQRGNSGNTGVKPGSLLAAKAATEYVYVAKDMRRILLVAAGLAAVMLILWLLLVVMRVVPLPFY